MTRTATTRALAGLAAAGLASVALAAVPATARADERTPYLAWQEPARKGDCPVILVRGRHVRDAGVATFRPEEHKTGWLVDSEAKGPNEIGDKNTRWVQNAVVEARIRVECDYDRQTFTRHYLPTKYRHRYSWTGSQCLLHWRTGNSGCLPYYIPGTSGGWRDGLAGTLR